MIPTFQEWIDSLCEQVKAIIGHIRTTAPEGWDFVKSKGYWRS